MAGRQFALYFSWSRPAEIEVDLGILENRYPTLFEFRRAIWPMADALRNPANFSQDVSGFLDHVVLFDFERFRQVIVEVTGNEVPIFQRESSKTQCQILDDNLLAEIDTLIVISLDHLRTNQTATVGEIQAIRSFLSREDRCVIVCPHHLIGVDNNHRETEFNHHGDRLVPPEQQIGGFARALLHGLDFELENQFGLSPGRTARGEPAKLNVSSDLDTWSVLHGVETFNLHPHLPHLSCTAGNSGKIAVLARQPINSAASGHPFVDAGNRSFNAFLQLESPDIGGKLFVCDATLWSSAFSGLPSLERLWKNLAEMT